MYFTGRRVSWPFTAQKKGIGVIHQRPSLDEQLDVISNIFLGNEIGNPRLLGILRVMDTDRMRRQAIDIVKQLGLDSSIIYEKVANLSGELRQMIAIARVMTSPMKMVIIDEPTVLLSYPNQQRVLGLISDWRQQGVSVIFSSNNMDHLFAVTDRIIVLHEGRQVADLRTDETKREEVVSLILGNEKPDRMIAPIWEFDSSDRIRELTDDLVS
jgi:ABC-type sugar transport system ATPase subunit